MPNAVQKTTIDWLDKEAHVRYAKDSAVYEKKYVEEAKWIPNHTEIAVITPTNSEADKLLEMNLGHTAWALFDPPKDYKKQSNRFFNTQLLPKVDIALVLEKFEGVVEKAFLDMGEKILSNYFERMKKMIVTLLDCLEHLNELLERVISERLQFQKG